MMGMIEKIEPKEKPCLTLKGDQYIEGVSIGEVIDKSLKLKLVEESIRDYDGEETKCQRFEVVSSKENGDTYGDSSRLKKMSKGDLK